MAAVESAVVVAGSSATIRTINSHATTRASPSSATSRPIASHATTKAIAPMPIRSTAARFSRTSPVVSVRDLTSDAAAAVRVAPTYTTPVDRDVRRTSHRGRPAT